MSDNIKQFTLKDGGKKDELPIVNEDELIGYIMRKAYEEYEWVLTFKDIQMVLDLELEFLTEAGLTGE